MAADLNRRARAVCLSQSKIAGRKYEEDKFSKGKYVYRKKQLTILTILIIMILYAGLSIPTLITVQAKETGAFRWEDIRREDNEIDQMRGIWLSCFDYAALGLTISENEERYRENADRFLEEAQKYGINIWIQRTLSLQRARAITNRSVCRDDTSSILFCVNVTSLPTGSGYQS